MKRGGGKPPKVEPEGAPFNSPFAALASKRAELPPGPPERPAPVKAAAAVPARAVVRMERAGRRGKEVTVVEKLELKPAMLAEWLQQLKQSLGCGGTLEDDTLVLQGDHRDRIRAWLEARGVKKISVG